MVLWFVFDACGVIWRILIGLELHIGYWFLGYLLSVRFLVLGVIFVSGFACCGGVLMFGFAWFVRFLDCLGLVIWVALFGWLFGWL